MPGRKRSDEWYSPYFAPSTIVVGVLVIIISVQAGRYAGNLMIARDMSRYQPATNLVEPLQHPAPTKAARPAPPAHEKLSPSANGSH
ncbi:MAG TPA: hypothetical protein VEJ41_04905 [Candidatus Acidoferrales bacterium]|nr:hypothetical protein [Candidatus Acidoferrales bacterium]